MIRGLLLILDAGGSWNKIAQAQRGFVFILFGHLLPLLVLTLGVESLAMTRLGAGRTITGDPIAVTVTAALRFGLAAVVLNLGLILLAAQIIRKIGDNLHSQASYVTCFRLLAYTLSPLFLLHLPDALPGINTWICYAAGIALSLGVLYLGIPIVLRPDPAKAMGIYLILAVLLTVLTGLAHFLAIQILHDQVNLRFWQDFV